MGDPLGGGEAAELTPVASHSPSFNEPTPLGIGANWVIAERAARGIILKVQPTSVSEERRGEVVDYIQRLIRNHLSVEVFPYGSVPLRTFLPDGDIDLTAFGSANVEDPLVDDVKYVLEQEEKNMSSGFVVKDVQLIHAEVKLVKCIVQDIVVDVSFNQIGGLCTLCFLEQVDQVIGKDHLFKRSIILTKAWCYYESRILGAHHGLISTYALETLVLYIFQLFHSMLDGPLAVLYKFLDYFSNFDWETYCVSLNGPVRLSSMPDIVVDMPEESDRDLLLSNDFLSSCVGLFSFPSRGSDRNSRGFQRKYLNIVDPLKEINNLGRSVSKGSFYRIRSAFSYGARKLAQILLQPEDSIPNELHKFFSNTLARHGGLRRPHLQDIDPLLVSKRRISGQLIPDNGYEFDNNAVSGGYIHSSSGTLSEDLFKALKQTSSNMAAITGQDNNFLLQHPVVSLDWDQASKLSTLGPRFHKNINDLSTLGLGGLTISTGSSIFKTPPLLESASASDERHHAPQLYFESILFNSRTQDGSPDSEKLVLSRSSGERVAAFGSMDNKQLIDCAKVMTSSKSKDLSWGRMTPSSSVDLTSTDLEQISSGKNEASESLRTSDLTGNYVRFLHWLKFGRWCYEYGSNMHSLTMPPLAPWDSLLSPSQFEHNGFSHRHYNGYHPSPAGYVLQPLVLPGVPFGLEEVAKAKSTGTGTYFPYTAQPPRGYRPSSMRGRNRASSGSPRNNGRNMIFEEPNMMVRGSHEPSQPQVPVDRIMMAHIDNHPTLSPHGNGFPKANGTSIQPEGVIEFEPVGPSSGQSMSEKFRQQRPASSSPRNLSGVRRPQLALSREQDR